MDAKNKPQPKDLSTPERLATTARAVVQGVGYSAQGEHETAEGARERVAVADAERIIERWPDPQKNVARQMLEKYGPPNEATPTKFFWYDNHPWKRTELTAESTMHHWPTVHSDFLTQTIDYQVPTSMYGMIAEFDGSVIPDRTRGELSARCDSEAANVLGLNMAHEIATGKRTVEEARKISTEHTVAYNLGRKAPYAEELLFEVPRGGTEDLDKGMISGAIARQTAGKVKDIVTGRSEEPTDRLTGTGRATD
jgi:hypothetical protein